MARSPAYQRIKSDVLAIVDALPPGRVATFADIGRHLDVMPRHVAYILTTLTDAEADRPWHRVVAEGGAVGRHKRRAVHIARLREEGIAVSDAGIVQDLGSRRVGTLAGPPSGVTRRPKSEEQPPQKSAAGARGVKLRPASTVAGGRRGGAR